jgi:hypothetical protein
MDQHEGTSDIFHQVGKLRKGLSSVRCMSTAHHQALAESGAPHTEDVEKLLISSPVLWPIVVGRPAFNLPLHSCSGALSGLVPASGCTSPYHRILVVKASQTVLIMRWLHQCKCTMTSCQLPCAVLLPALDGPPTSRPATAALLFLPLRRRKLA